MRVLTLFLALALLAAVGCGGTETVVQTVVVEKPVEKVIQQTVVVEKPVEKVVQQTVVVEKEKVVEKAVAQTVVVVATPVPTPLTAQVGFLQRAIEPSPKRGGILRVTLPSNTTHFDLQQGGAASTLGHGYNELVFYNYSDGFKSLAPDLAVSWEVTDGGKLYTFKLRPAVRFHDGSEFDADDVVATFTRIIKPPANVAPVGASLLSAVESVSKIDKYAVQFRLKSPVPYLLNVLADDTFAIFSKDELDKNSQDLRKVQIPTGTGAFKFKRYAEGETIEWDANREYWNRELPYLDGVKIIHTPDVANRGIAVLTGISDFTFNTGTGPWKEGQKKPQEFKTALNPGRDAPIVEFNMKVKPLDDARVRKAMHLVMNRQLINEVYSQTVHALNNVGWMVPGLGYNLTRPEVESIPGWRPDKSADIQTAKQLLADAGFPNGSGFPTVDFVCINPTFASELLCPSTVEQFKTHLGITLKMRLVERAQIQTEWRNGTFGMSYEALGTPVQHPAAWFTPIIGTGGSRNFWGYSNAKVDSLLAQLAVEQDFNKAYALVRDVEKILDEDPPFINLGGYSLHQPLMRSYVKGMDWSVKSFSHFSRIEVLWLDK